MKRGLIWTALVILGACGSQPLSFAGTDCGTSTAGPGPGYDSQAVDCVWKAYSSGTAVQWKVKSQTVEGDPIPGTLRFDQVLGVVITRDMTADKFSNQADRRMWTWRCAKMTETPWATDPSRYFFELSACTGDGPSATFP
jgi:hypothetical protein